MSFFSGSVDKRLTSVDEFLPRKKKRKNGNGKNGGRGAKEAAMGFEAPEFFGGLKSNGKGRGIPKADKQDFDIGVEIPELGQGFNSRIGQIGSGFTEQVNPFRVGFTDVLTGNGRTGEIIGGGFGTVTPGLKRKRGRPKGSGKKQQKALAKKLGAKGVVSVTTKGAKTLRAEAVQLAKAGDIEGARAKLAQIRTASVGTLAKEGIKSKASDVKRAIQERARLKREPGLAGAIAFQEQEFADDDIRPVAIRDEGVGTRPLEVEREKGVDVEQVGRFQEQLAVERASKEDVEELIPDESEDEFTETKAELGEGIGELVEEDEEDSGVDEDLDDVDENDVDFDVQQGDFQGEIERR